MWSTAFAGIAFFIDSAEQLAKGFPLDSPFQLRQGVAEAFKQFGTVFVVKEAGLHGFSEGLCAKAILSLIWVGF